MVVHHTLNPSKAVTISLHCFHLTSILIIATHLHQKNNQHFISFKIQFIFLHDVKCSQHETCINAYIELVKMLWKLFHMGSNEKFIFSCVLIYFVLQDCQNWWSDSECENDRQKESQLLFFYTQNQPNAACDKLTKRMRVCSFCK